MKIVFLTSDFYPRIGGGENYILNLAKEFSKKNEVFVLCPNELSSGNKNIFNLNIHYLPFYMICKSKFIKPWTLYKNIKELNPDIMYSSGPSIMDFFSVFFAKILKKKIAITYHADLDLSKLSSRIFTKIYFLFCLPFYNKIIVTTKQYKKILLKRDIKCKKIFIIPVGFENRNKKFDFNKKNKKKVQLLFVGVLDAQHTYKNLDVLITAIKYLSEDKFVLNIVGEGNLKSKYHKLSKKMNLSNINFLGKISENELIYQYKHSDIFVLPSDTNKEGFGIVLLEALSFGCKIITGEHCGGAFLIKENQEFGSLYDSTAIDLAKKIKESSLKRISAYKIEKELKKFEWNKVSNDIADVLIN